MCCIGIYYLYSYIDNALRLPCMRNEQAGVRYLCVCVRVCVHACLIRVTDFFLKINGTGAGNSGDLV